MKTEISFLMGWLLGLISGIILLTLIILVDGNNNRITTINQTDEGIKVSSNYNAIGDTLIINGDISIKDENGWHKLYNND